MVSTFCHDCPDVLLKTRHFCTFRVNKDSNIPSYMIIAYFIERFGILISDLP